MKRLLSTLALLIAFRFGASTNICAAEDSPATKSNIVLRADSPISGAAWVQDIDILEHAYKTMHPGLYRYNSPAEVDLMFDALRDRFRGGTTLAEAYVSLAEFGARIRCGHTYPNFFNQDKPVVNALFTGTNRVPFRFIWLDDRMLIRKNLGSNAVFTPGTEVLRINGVKAGDVLKRLMKLARADGANDAKRRAILQMQETSRFEMFDIYYSLCFPLKSDRFDLEVKPFGATHITSLTVEPLSQETRHRPVGSGKDEVLGGSGWVLSFPKTNVACLKMPTWALYNTKWDWTNYLDQTFTNLAARPDTSLIIDVRDNEGGLTDVGQVIAGHLIQKSIPLAQTQRYVRYRSAPRDLIPYLDTWDWSFLDWGTNVLTAAYLPAGNAVYYRMTKFDDGKAGDVMEPRAPRFRGRVVVLMNSENSSATFQFEQIVQQHRLAKLIGQPSGGNKRGINGGAFFFLHLPNSKIEMDLPLVASLPTTPQPDEGLTPDVPVNVTASGLAAGKDETMEAALRYLNAR